MPYAMQRLLRRFDLLAVSGRAMCLSTANHFADRQHFNVEEIEFAAKPMREQSTLFYATVVPLKILSITAPDQ